ncbi:sodium-dependent transporter [Ruminococcus sp.]|uniref:sodium-dependent transporter n=1 Tax=Ruminococcus sp. TaxID=41978 RepID=UPI003FD8C141
MQTKTQNEKAGFGSKLGFILAAAGSAVGLGNIWRFPYLAAKYGGGMFLLLYLIFAVTFGFALMTTEIAIGRRTGKSVIQAYSDMNRHFKPLGWLAGAIPVIILPYYCVIGGWVLRYLTTFVSGGGKSAAGDGSYFTNFISHAGTPMLFFGIFIALTAVVVMLGVQKGIEKVSKFMMPLLLVLIVGISIYTLTLPGAIDGLIYYIKPDFSEFSIKTVIAAVGQLFYSMSLAMGIMITYGSYMRKEDSIESSVRQIEVFDTAVAFLAGLIIVPAVFVFSGGDKSALNAGPSLMFITLPNVFHDMVGGQIVGIVFFLLVALAAMTSSISLMETVVSIVEERFHWKRTPSCLIVTGVSFLIGLLSVFGYSIWSDFTIFHMQMLDFFDYISNNIMMPIVALMTCILVGFVVKTTYVENEIEKNERFRSKGLYRIMIKFICPICMLLILFSSLFLTL